MKIRMELLSDAIFGNGMSIPGGEDISVLKDAQFDSGSSQQKSDDEEMSED